MSILNTTIQLKGSIEMFNAKKRIWIAVLAPVIFFGMIGGACLYVYATLEKHIQPNLIPPSSFWADPNKPLQDQTALANIGGRKFKIPLMYIQSKLPLDRQFEDSILLNVIWPQMKSLQELKNKNEYNQVTRIHHYTGDILLATASRKPSLDEQVANTIPGLTRSENFGTKDGLEHYLWYRGLPEKPEPWEEVYLEKDKSGHIVTRINCTRGAIARFPVCNQSFVNNGLLYKISYNEGAFFSDWREQQLRAINFINKFEISESPPHERK